MLPERKPAPLPDVSCAKRRRARRDWQARTNPRLRSTLPHPHGRRRRTRGNLWPTVLAATAGLIALAGAAAWGMPLLRQAGLLTAGPLGTWREPWALAALRVAGPAAAGALMGWGWIRRRRHRCRPPVRTSQLQRHLLRTRGLGTTLHHWPRVYVDGLEGLLRLAIAERRPVLASAAEEPPLYCVMAHGVAYVHVPDG